MNILYISAVLPYPLHSGGQVRIYNLLRHLSRKHTIFLLSFIRQESEKSYLKDLNFVTHVRTAYRGRVWQAKYFLRSLTGRLPLLYASYENNDMRNSIGNILTSEKIDLIHIEPSYVWPSVPKNDLPLVVSEHNIEYDVYNQFVSRMPFFPLRPLLHYDVVKHTRLEKYVWSRANHITAVSESDAESIRQQNQLVPVTVVPNGVDIDWIHFKKRDAINKNPVCLFVGNFYWMENRDALAYLVDNIWPGIQTEFPGAKLRVVGRNIPRNLKLKVAHIQADVREVVDDIRTQYQEADILMAPIRVGGGTKYKILEAMASGLPVITSIKGTEGLAIRNRMHVLVAESPQNYVQAVNTLMSDKMLLGNICRQARDCIEKNYSWKLISQKLDTVWQRTYEKAH